MPTSKQIQSKLKKGVDDAIAARGKTRQPPALAHLARLPGTVDALRDLTSYVRQARDHLQKMAAKTGEAHAEIVAEAEAEYKHWGMVPGEKPNQWVDELGSDRRIVAKNRAIELGKKNHAKNTEAARADVIGALRSVRTDLNAVEPLFHSQIAMLLRSTNSDGKRAQYMRTLQGAGVIAIENAVLDAVIGEGNRALGAAIITILEQDDKLASRVKYSREEIADTLIHEDYWTAQMWMGLTRWFIESSEVAVLELEGKSISTDRKTRAGLMRLELEKTVGKTFNEAGDEIDAEGEIVKVEAPAPHDYYDNLLAESRKKDAAVVAGKRQQAAARKKAAEDEVSEIVNRTEAEENALYGGAS